MKIIDNIDGKNFVINTKEINSDVVVNLNGDVTKKILESIKKIPKYPKQIAKEIGLHEQNVYYYIRKLEKSNIIGVIKQENINGTIANFYGILSDSFFFKINDFKESSKVVEKETDYLKPFVNNGRLDALIIVGSPDPHGPQKARSKDGYYGMDFALFLGTFLNYVPDSFVKLDTEVTDKDLEDNNLIVIGGPIVNKVTMLAGDNLEIYFDEEKRGVYSKITKKIYYNDEIGFINKTKSPFNSKREILLLAGLRNAGTKAVILAFLKHFVEVRNGNKFNSKVMSHVVEGVDLDSDGFVDDCEFLE